MAAKAAKADAKAPLGSGGRFAAFKGKVAQEYEKKGMSPQKAEQVGAAVAAKAGRAKYGNKRMGQMAAGGKKG